MPDLLSLKYVPEIVHVMVVNTVRFIVKRLNLASTRRDKVL